MFTTLTYITDSYLVLSLSPPVMQSTETVRELGLQLPACNYSYVLQIAG